jgi:type III pantothenate kinase
MNLVIDIGNTNIKVGCFRNGEPVSAAIAEHFDIETARDWIRAYGITQAIISSVRDTDTALTEFLQENTAGFINLSHTTPLPFKNLYRTPESLGKDRIAAVAGAFLSYPSSNSLVIDMGTAITFDIISKNGEYLGGNISPGLMTRFKALHTFTSHLPMLGKADIPDNLGNDTSTAIIAGVQQGIIFEIHGYVDHFTSLYSDLSVILTGGDAEFLAGKLKRTIFVIPNLVLKGLNYILDYNAQQKLERVNE